MERMQNERMPEEIATATMEGTRRRGRSRKRWRDEVEEDLNTMGIKNRQAVARDRREWSKIVLEGEVHNELWVLINILRTHFC